MTLFSRDRDRPGPERGHVFHTTLPMVQSGPGSESYRVTKMKPGDSGSLHTGATTPLDSSAPLLCLLLGPLSPRAGTLGPPRQGPSGDWSTDISALTGGPSGLLPEVGSGQVRRFRIDGSPTTKFTHHTVFRCLLDRRSRRESWVGLEDDGPVLDPWS